ncbi:hypothetical protein GC105_10700 [Alkalibaculum sp. M08DMB]|uniref:Uncharacterized protein n=1 Tax=Alkalibaculum sporogenes TaxID=2655001 RepID=A0A6A7KA38_9FIRM|nr:hypothetical protein [Alkalibaculum sporogenes]MPW26256.1 hypothetical protein [Alkalibaculum sporogenes]
MTYIDKAYFEEYSDMVIDDDEFGVLSKRSEDIINSLTGDLQGVEFISLPSSFQEKVKKATAAQVETLYLQGGTESMVGGNISGASIGKFSYNTGGSQSNMPVSPLISMYLGRTGLLYQGVTVI